LVSINGKIPEVILISLPVLQKNIISAEDAENARGTSAQNTNSYADLFECTGKL
jgi:hypothetical protein